MESGPVPIRTVGQIMNSPSNTDELWKEVANIPPYGQMLRDKFVRINDEQALTSWREQHQNKDLFISTAGYTAPGRQADYVSPLYFEIVSNDPEEVRKDTAAAFLHLVQLLGTQDDFLEVIYNGGGVDGVAINTDNTASQQDDYGRYTCDKNCVAFKMIIMIPPVVFGGEPTAFMPVINYQLARELLAAGIGHIDIDVYQRDHFVRLPNSINSTTGRFVIQLELKELMYMDANGIIELSKQPRPECSLITPGEAPQAIRWLVKSHKEAERNHKKNKQLQDALLRRGWEILPCIRRLSWADLPKTAALEACRMISQFYPYVGAAESETWRYIGYVDRRNSICEHERLKAIVRFGMENPRLNCEAALLQELCPAGKCCVPRLVAECEQPSLFGAGVCPQLSL